VYVYIFCISVIREDAYEKQTTYVGVKVKVKFTLEQATEAQSGSRL